MLALLKWCITSGELALGSFTRRKLKQIPIWDLCFASAWKRMEAS
jgi:hypothetical protein